MKTKNYLFLFGLLAAFAACSKDDSNDGEENSDDLNLVGQEGNPRFNLQFSNGDNVDLDLYVETPNGEVIYYSNPTADNGELDVDCMCSSCPQGANENIFWEDGTAPSGTYSYYVDYFGDCGDTGASSDFTLRVIRNGEVIATKTGTLDEEGQSPTWTYEHP